MRTLTHFLCGCSLLVVLALFAVSCSSPSSPSPVANLSTPTPTPSPITPTELDDAQAKWCAGLVKIATLSRPPVGDWEGEANRFVDEMYDFNGPYKLLFRPTLAYPPHAFRTDRPGTLSYFIGGNEHDYPNDGQGFARGPWKACGYSNDLPGGVKGIQIYGNTALVMGTVTIKDLQDKPTTVDKIFVFRKLGENNLKLIAHMSAKSNEAPTPTPTPCPK
jgi:hypothetical protein